MHLLITRPKHQAEDLQKTLQQKGHTFILAPLLEISFQHPTLTLDSLQAIVVTSQNAVRALRTHPDYEKIKNFPFVVVGSATAAAARNAGFTLMIEGRSGAEDLAQHIKDRCTPQGGALLHARGDVVAFNLEDALRPFGFEIRQSLVYLTTPIEVLPPNVVEALQMETLGGVLLMSPRTSQVWWHLTGAAGLKDKLRRVVHFCLSEAVAAPLKGTPRVPIAIAPQPNLEALCDLITQVSSASSNVCSPSIN